MEVIYWQLAVAGSTAAAYLIGTRMVAFGVATAWTLWTLLMLSHTPLIILQLASTWGTLLVLDRFAIQQRELAKFKSAISDFREDDRAALITARNEGKFKILSDSSHHKFMLAQIASAETSIMILSGWISDKVIDSEFVRTLSSALKRGVKVYIGFGFEDWSGIHDVSRPAKRALESLEQLAKQEPGIAVAQFNNHQKALVIDERLVVCGSHNWLSNHAFRNREQSFIIEDSSAAQAVFAHSSPLIESNPAFDTRR